MARGFRQPRRSSVVGAAALVILAAAGVGIYVATTGSGPRYRTAAVISATVHKTLSATATAAPETSVDASYAGSGTVASVAVKAGQHVSAGQVLANLDTTSLETDLSEAKATTAQAKLTLTKAENGQITAATGGASGAPSASGGSGSFTASATSATSTGSVQPVGDAVSAHAVLAVVSGPPAGGGKPGPGGSPATGATAASVSGLQTQVVGGQHALDTALATARQRLVQTTAACAGGGPHRTAPPSPGPVPTPTATASSTSPPATPGDAATDSPTATPSRTPPSTGYGSQACASAETALLASQTVVAADETALASALTALDNALDKTITQQRSSGSGTSQGSSGVPSGTGSPTTTGGSAPSTTPTAAQLAAYEAKVDAASAAQAVAQQNLDMATLRSPIRGTVMSVGLSAGDSASAGSIEVTNPDAFVFTTSVSVSDVPSLKNGQQVTVTPDGTSESVNGTVARVAAAPDSSGDYAVTIGIDIVPSTVRSGSTASIAITLASSSGGLTLPTSAISTLNGLKLVRVLKDGHVTTVPVTVVTSGATLSEVRGNGLGAGDKVVLADLAAALPASNSSTTNNQSGLSGGFSTNFGGLGSGTGGFQGVAPRGR